MLIPTIDRRTTRPSDITPIIHELHPTGLETFMACPYKFHIQQTRSDMLPATAENARDAFYE